MSLRKCSFIKSVSLFLLSILPLSCATNKNLYIPVDNAVNINAFEKAVAEIDKAQGVSPNGRQRPGNPIYKDDNQISYYLDKGILEHYAGNYTASYQDLEKAEKAINDAYTKSITAGIASYIANDNTREYAGEDYEDVYVNIFNALNSYHIDDAQSLSFIEELVRQDGTLDKIAKKYDGEPSKIKEGFAIAAKAVGSVISLNTIDWPPSKQITLYDSALARYLSAVFNLNFGNKDAARYDMMRLQRVFTGIPPEYNDDKITSVARAAAVPFANKSIPQFLLVSGERGDETGPLLDIPAGQGQLNVLAFAGLSPYKEEKIDVMAMPLLALVYPSLLYSRANLKVPALRERPSLITGISVNVSGNQFNLELLEDMGAVMTDTFNGHASSVYLKTYARVLAKLVVAAAAGKTTEDRLRKNGMPEMVANISGLAVVEAARTALDESEAADVRSARYLPAKAYIGAINLDPGNYEITVNYLGGDTITKTATVKAGKISLVETVCLK